MPFIELGTEFGDTKEPELAPSGQAFDLLCKDVEEHQKDGKTSLRILILIQSPDANYAPFSLFLSMPNRELDQRNDEEKGLAPGTTKNFKLLQIKRFLHAFNVPFTGSGFNPQDIPGAQARLPLDQEEYNGRRNQRLNLPPLPGETNLTTDGAAGAEVSKKKAKA